MRGQRFAGGAEPVGLVVDHDVARLVGRPDAEHHVDRAAEVAAEQLVAERRRLEAIGVGAHRVVGGRCRREHGGHRGEQVLGSRGASPPAERELEVELAQPVAQTEVRPVCDRRRAGRAGCAASAAAPRRVAGRWRRPTTTAAARRPAPRARPAGRARTGRRARARRAPTSRRSRRRAAPPCGEAGRRRSRPAPRGGGRGAAPRSTSASVCSSTVPATSGSLSRAVSHRSSARISPE